jgi:hypothetical protein
MEKCIQDRMKVDNCIGCGVCQPPAAPGGEAELLNKMAQAYHDLKEYGWNDAVYCPKDSTIFLAIEAGSTGIHECLYEGEWPKGCWWILASGDMWPSRPILWKPKEDAP